jgi:SET domain
MALHALAQCAARLLLVHQQPAGSSRDEVCALRDDWRVYRAFAELGMEERAKGGWCVCTVSPLPPPVLKPAYSIRLLSLSITRLHGAEPDRETWQVAHMAFVQAFVLPPDLASQKKLAKLLKRPIPKDVADALFTYDGFLHGLGRMNLSCVMGPPPAYFFYLIFFLLIHGMVDLEAHGGLYTLHSHLNHSCHPNIAVRHLDQRTALSRITMVAKREIGVGEELLVTYVNPSLGVHERRSQLEAWGFGECNCERCAKEEKETRVDPLERELKAGLGVM